MRRWAIGETGRESEEMYRKSYHKPHHAPAAESNLPQNKKNMDALIDKHMESLCNELATGNSEKLVAYLQWSVRFHKYSLGNQMLIWEQMPEATRVAGYQTWLSLGQQVAKGSKGIYILAPRTYERAKKGQPDEMETALYFKATYVFDASQLDASAATKPMPQFWQKLGEDAQPLYDRLVRAAVKDGRRVEEREGALRKINQDVQGFNHRSLIVVQAGADATNKLLTLIHEYAHSLLHWDKDGQLRQDLTTQQREAQAEATAYVVALQLGIHNPFSADYVRHFGQTPQSLRAELEAVRSAAGHIMDVLEAEPEAALVAAD